MSIGYDTDFLLSHAEIFAYLREVSAREFPVIAAHQLQSLLARHMAILNETAGHADGAAEAELDVHHVVIEVVYGVVDTIEALE